MEDAAIVDLYWQRSDQAISETDRKYGKYCHTIAYNICANNEDAEECVNDTWFSAWNMMPDKRPSTPRRINRKLFSSLLVAAILISLFTVTAYAICWSLRGTATHSMPETGEYTSLSQLPKVERTVRYPITVPDSFSNGYRFSQLRVDGMADYDDNGDMLREYYVVNVTYTKPNTGIVWLNIAPLHEASADQAVQGADIRQIEGIPVSFRLDTYKFVPDDYEKTEEDNASETGGRFFVTYGADAISVTEIAFVSFDMNNARYTLMVYDATQDDLEMLGQLASELIASGIKHD